MISPLFTQWKLIGAALALLTVLAASAVVGAVVNAWRLDGTHQRAIAVQRTDYAALLERYNTLLLRVERQNGAATLMEYKTQAADERRVQAERWAAGAVQASERRIDEIKASTATSCEGVLREAWGKR